MRQYCEYCAFLLTGNGIYCEAHNKELKESTTKTVNHCKDFEFLSASAYDLDKTYKPRQKRKAPTNQITIEEV